MNKIILSIFIILLIFTGCSDFIQNKTFSIKQDSKGDLWLYNSSKKTYGLISVISTSLGFDLYLSIPYEGNRKYALERKPEKRGLTTYYCHGKVWINLKTSPYNSEKNDLLSLTPTYTIFFPGDNLPFSSTVENEVLKNSLNNNITGYFIVPAYVPIANDFARELQLWENFLKQGASPYLFKSVFHKVIF